MYMISVIVPVYNTEKFLNKCIESILNQTYKDIQIVLVDDGSTDGSGEICDSYSLKDDRVDVIHKKNGGLVSARKAGLMASKGQYVGFVDSDDWIEPDMYEKLYNSLIENEADISMCGRFEDSDFSSKPVYHGIAKGLYKGSRLINEVFPKMIVNEQFFEWGLFPSYWDKLFKREVIKDYLFSVDDGIVMGEDAAGVYPCLLNTNSICVLKDCLYHYRQTSNSMVKRSVDVETERYRFRLLYSATKNKLSGGNDIYDCSSQWLKYVLFLMIPRADVLYKDIDKLDYLFPFPNVKRGDEILIYGAGLWGKRLYKYLKITEFCKVAGIVDINYQKIRTNDFEVISPDDISRLKFDSIVVPASYANSRKAIVKELSQKHPGVDIYEPNEELIFSEQTLEAFGLL